MDRRAMLHRLLATAGTASIAGYAGQQSQSAATSAEDITAPTMSQSELTNTSDAATKNAQLDDAGLVTVESDESVEATVETIEGRIERSPLTLLTTVDHAANAASVDRELPPTTLLILGNPDVGTPLMQAGRTVAIDLPQKMLVWEDEERAVNITYNDPQYLARRHGIDGQDSRLASIAAALEKLATGTSEC